MSLLLLVVVVVAAVVAVVVVVAVAVAVVVVVVVVVLLSLLFILNSYRTEMTGESRSEQIPVNMFQLTLSEAMFNKIIVCSGYLLVTHCTLL